MSKIAIWKPFNILYPILNCGITVIRQSYDLFVTRRQDSIFPKQRSQHHFQHLYLSLSKPDLSTANKQSECQWPAFQRLSWIYFLIIGRQHFGIFTIPSPLSALRHPDLFSQKFGILNRKIITLFIRIIIQHLVKLNQQKRLKLWFRKKEVWAKVKKWFSAKNDQMLVTDVRDKMYWWQV